MDRVFFVVFGLFVVFFFVIAGRQARVFRRGVLPSCRRERAKRASAAPVDKRLSAEPHHREMMCDP